MTLVIAICFTPHLMINQATTSRDRQQTYDQQFKAHEILEAVPEIDVPYDTSGTDIQFLRQMIDSTTTFRSKAVATSESNFSNCNPYE